MDFGKGLLYRSYAFLRLHCSISEVALSAFILRGGFYHRSFADLPGLSMRFLQALACFFCIRKEIVSIAVIHKSWCGALTGLQSLIKKHGYKQALCGLCGSPISQRLTHQQALHIDRTKP